MKFKEEMKSQHEDIINAQRALRVKVHMKNDINAYVCELNYKSHIEYLTEIIVKTTIVYVVGPRNTFVNH